jgi:hypothetical protein
MKRIFALSLGLVLVLAASAPLSAQWSVMNPGSPNMKVVSHLPLGAALSVADMDMEQEMDRPYVYISRMVYGEKGPKGTDIISIADPENPELLYEWRIENQDLHQRTGGMDVKHFKLNDRYYLVQSLQFGQGGPDNDLGAVVLDVTGLPDPSTVREVARIRNTDSPGGFHNIFIYVHTSGKVLLITTLRADYAGVYDLEMVVEGDVDNALIAQIPNPNAAGGGYHDFYAAYHPDTDSDRFYGGGTGGYYVYDITDLDAPDLVVSLTGISGVRSGHTFTPTPDGNFVVAETEYQYAPLRIFDLRPALEGQVSNIGRPISAWTADWRNLAHNHEMRWPYVFVSGYRDGLQVFSMMDPEHPVSVGYYDTLSETPYNGASGPVFDGAFGVDVRNADGLIVVSDMTTGLWVFTMDGFQGWNGEQWGMPNISSAQNWDSPPKRLIGDDGR